MQQLLDLQTAGLTGDGLSEILAVKATLNRVIAMLEQIKSKMLDIESFNEIIDLVRELLDDQETLLKETQEQQKAQLLDILGTPF